jgi:hypothetical protein
LSFRSRAAGEESAFVFVVAFDFGLAKSQELRAKGQFLLLSLLLLFKSQIANYQLQLWF